MKSPVSRIFPSFSHASDPKRLALQLQAALLWGTCDGSDRWVASIGGEVALILRELDAQPGMVTDPKAAVDLVRFTQGMWVAWGLLG